MSSGDVRVFSVDLDQPAEVVERLDAVLVADERVASAHVRVARAVMRIVLADVLGTDPVRVPISRRCAHCGHPTHGRPTIAGDERISFSLSHSGAFALIAIDNGGAAGGARVGVDVEEVRPRRRLDALAARILNDDEHAAWLAVDDTDERLRSFLRSWTAKEAYLKALGIGIATRLREVPRHVDGWQTRELDVGARHIAALAVDRTEVTVRTGDLRPLTAGYGSFVLDDDEDWADEDWAGDGDSTDEDPDGTIVGHARPAPIERFRRTSVGTVFAAGLFGLREVLEPPKDETPAIVEEWSGAKPFQDPIVLRLDPDHPEDSIVMIRPWLNAKRPES